MNTGTECARIVSSMTMAAIHNRGKNSTTRQSIKYEAISAALNSGRISFMLEFRGKKRCRETKSVLFVALSFQDGGKFDFCGFESIKNGQKGSHLYPLNILLWNLVVASARPGTGEGASPLSPVTPTLCALSFVTCYHRKRSTWFCTWRTREQGSGSRLRACSNSATLKAC